MCPEWMLLAWGSCRQAVKKWGILGDWSGVHIWLSLVGPKLETGQKLGKLAVINQVLAIWSQLFLK